MTKVLEWLKGNPSLKGLLEEKLSSEHNSDHHPACVLVHGRYIRQKQLLHRTLGLLVHNQIRRDAGELAIGVRCEIAIQIMLSWQGPRSASRGFREIQAVYAECEAIGNGVPFYATLLLEDEKMKARRRLRTSREIVSMMRAT